MAAFRGFADIEVAVVVPRDLRRLEIKPLPAQVGSELAS
jgi:hypothetical protein